MDNVAVHGAERGAAVAHRSDVLDGLRGQVPLPPSLR